MCRILRQSAFLGLILLACGGTGRSATADAPAPRMFGRGAPFTVRDLPSSPLRSRLESLTPVARDKALQWLNGIEFPSADVQSLQVDAEGGVFYADTPPPLPAEVAPLAVPAPAVDNPFILHSRPGAPNKVYLDFNGHTISGTAWNGSTPTLTARPFDLDGSESTYNAAEKAAIAEIWHRVAEDLIIFNIDVTTEDPVTFGPKVGRLLITKSVDAAGIPMPSSNAGGVAYVGVWGYSNYASYYSPALVYQNNLANGTTYISEAATHEFGHNLGLSHDGTFDGTTTVGYYQGHGSDYTSWAPLMGVGYYKNVTQWSKGEYTNANNTQDDLAIIQAKLALAADDHGDTRALSSTLVVSSTGAVSATTPQTDAGNQAVANKGVIGLAGDKDVFLFKAGSGPLTLTIKPAWAAFTRSSLRGANLDVRAVLMDSAGTTLATADISTDTYATISRTMTEGNYYLEVSAINSVNYGLYACQGEYFITGQMTPPGSSDGTPPTVSITSPAGGTTYTSAQTVTISASATDNVGVTRVDFYDGATLAASDTTSPYSHTWTFTETSNGVHTWTARAYDAAGNNTASGAVALTVAVPDTQAPTVAFTTPVTGTTYTAAQTVTIGVTASDNVGVRRVEFRDGAVLIRTDEESPFSHPWTITQSANGVHVWSATAYDAAGNSRTATTTVTVAITDIQAPVVSLQSSANGPFTTPQNVTLVAPAQDNVGIARVEFYDGDELAGTDTTAPYTFDWNITIAANGGHSWTARAYDSAGNMGESSAIDLLVAVPTDNGSPPPTVRILAFPNPARGSDIPVLRTVIPGDAADIIAVDLTLFDRAGNVVHSAAVPLGAVTSEGGVSYLDYPWRGDIASGRYHAVVVVRRTGGTVTRRTGITVLR
jgi:hypothetical protein